MNIDDINLGDFGPDLDDVMIDLTGDDMESAQDDHAGTYFERDKWVDADGIGRALVRAYLIGKGERP